MSGITDISSTNRPMSGWPEINNAKAAEAWSQCLAVSRLKSRTTRIEQELSGANATEKLARLCDQIFQEARTCAGGQAEMDRLANDEGSTLAYKLMKLDYWQENERRAFCNIIFAVTCIVIGLVGVGLITAGAIVSMPILWGFGIFALALAILMPLSVIDDLD
jgi:hypothetical protein